MTTILANMNMIMTKVNTMTTRKKSRPNRQLGILKLAVAAGSLAASLLGTRLLAKQEDVVVQSNDTAVSVEPIVLPSSKISAPVRQELSLDLPAIPQAVSPQIQAMPPVASSTSSK